MYPYSFRRPVQALCIRYGGGTSMSDLEKTNTRKKPLILVVDDDLLVRVMLQDALTAAGFEAAQAADGDAALYSFAALQPDLALL